MKVSELEGQFHTADGESVASFEDARHFSFRCPTCLGTTHDHRISIPRAPSQVAWDFSGSSLEDLTLHPSIRVHAQRSAEWPDSCPGWHGWVRNGDLVLD